MFVKTVTRRSNGRVYRYVQLVESYRREEDGLPTQRVIANLGDLPERTVENLKMALNAAREGSGLVLAEDAADRLRDTKVLANLRYLDVAVCMTMWEDWGLTELIGELVGCEKSTVSTGQIVAGLALHRCTEPGSKHRAEEWYSNTTLPELTGIDPRHFNNTRFHRALKSLHAIGDKLQAKLPELYQSRQGAFACCFMDVTKTHFEGGRYDLAERTRIRDGSVRKRIGIVLLANDAGYPLRWQVVPGRTNDIKAMGQMTRRLTSVDWLREVPVIFDRAMGDEKTVRSLLGTGLYFLTAAHVNAIDSYTDSLPRRFRPSLLVAATAGLCPVPGVAWWPERRQMQPPSTAPREPLGSLADEGPALPWRAVSSTESEGTEESYESDIQAVAGAVQAAGFSEVSRNLLAKDLRVVEVHSPDLARQQPANESQGETTTPFFLRLVAYFNPQMCIDQRRRAAQHLEDLDHFVGELNNELGRAKRSRGEEPTRAKIRKKLETRNWLGLFDVELTPIEVTHGKGTTIRSFECKVSLRQEAWARRRRYDGFVLLLGHPMLAQSAGELALLYRAKDKVEKDFQTIKSAVKLRPIFHYTDPKVQAHVNLCMLALLLKRTLEHRLRTAGLSLTAEAATEALSHCRLNPLRDPFDGATIYTLTESSRIQCEILQALNLTHLIDGATVSRSVRPRQSALPTLSPDQDAPVSFSS